MVGTRIAYDMLGLGPPLVVVWGAATGTVITVGEVYAQAYDPAGAPVRATRLLQIGRLYPTLTAVALGVLTARTLAAALTAIPEGAPA